MNPVEQPTADYPNPLSNPAHWWHKRGPQTEAEVAHFQGWKFTFQPAFEHVLLVQGRYPDLAAHLATDITSAVDALAKYKRDREFAIGVGRVPPLMTSLADLDAAAELVRTGRDGRAAAHSDGRAAFVAALERGELPVKEWRAWRNACRQARIDQQRIAGARQLLGLVGGSEVLPATPGTGFTPGPIFAEIQQALDEIGALD